MTTIIYKLNQEMIFLLSDLKVSIFGMVAFCRRLYVKRFLIGPYTKKLATMSTIGKENVF